MKRISFLLLVVIMAASCSKKDSAPIKPGKQLVKTSLDFGNNTEYNYDGQGCISKLVSGDQEVFYTYGSNSITEKTRVVSLNYTQSEITYALNNKGLAVSATGFYQPTPNTAIATVAVANTFDADGRLSVEKVTIDGVTSTTEFYYADGDMIEAKYFYSNIFSGKTRFFYPSKLINKTSLGGTDRQYTPGATYFGPINKHLVEKVESVDKNGVVTSAFTSVYTLDADGYPAKRILTGNTVNTMSYFYN
jgi:hypothetical protein